MRLLYCIGVVVKRLFLLLTYMQGGLTYESGKLGILRAAQMMGAGK